MLLMNVDVKYVLVEFHNTPTASEESAVGGYWRVALWFGDEAKCITLIVGRIHPWDSRSNAK